MYLVVCKRCSVDKCVHVTSGKSQIYVVGCGMEDMDVINRSEGIFLCLSNEFC